MVEITSHERARAGGEAKSRVVRHGTRFLLRILWEGLRGVRPAVVRAVPHGDPARLKSSMAALPETSAKRAGLPDGTLR